MHAMDNISTINLIGSILFAIAILHTFSTKYFEHLAHTHKKFSGLLHLLGEVEIVFGFWAMVLVIFMFALEGKTSAVEYVDSRNFTEPMFVFVIMVIAATKPILEFSEKLVILLSKLIPIKKEIGMFVLFLNISIGGTLTPYAAPPVLMVAGTWNWDIIFMLENFGWRSAIAVLINAGLLTFLFRNEIKNINFNPQVKSVVPSVLTIIHLLFLLGVVIFAHHPAVFMSLFLFFLGITTAYKHYQSELILKEALLVAFFLAGLVVIGGVQQWWLQPVLVSMSDNAVYFGATILTAFTDNAALTYLGSLVEGLSDPFKISLVAGAVTGGGLTVIANAPNPAGISILKKYFNEEAVSPLGLLFGALIPTLVAVVLFRVI